MKSLHGLLAGALLLVAVAGCSEDSKTVKGTGSYAPIITGLKNATGEPAIRGIPNDLQVIVTNVNALPLTVHWAATAGVFSDSTTLDAVWTPPDTVGTYSITVSVEASDATQYFFKTTTFSVYVDNLYERWTKTDAIQFDPAPTTSGALVYAEIRNNVTGEGDVYRVSSPMGGAEQISTSFYRVSSPTPRGDEQQIAFAGRRRSSDSTSIWLVPWSGADTLGATKLSQANTQFQRFLAHPRFAWNGGFLMYASDSNLVGFPKLWYRDVINPAAPVPFMSVANNSNLVLDSYLPANWGPGGSNVAAPESVVTQSFELFNNVGQTARGAFKFKTLLFGQTPPTSDQAWIADTTFAEPDWSSDGKYIVFSRRDPAASDRDIWIVATNATSLAEAKQVTRGPADDFHPRFSKDGNTIYFVSNRQDRYGLNGLFLTERRGTNLWSVRRFDLP
ncbi:MAG TPA: hypothetical protein VFS09_04135 [Candidatus Eisenbacteria bacterium]|nr:hypothetical protein [Candidatus Eisenbacteria bacterium]